MHEFFIYCRTTDSAFYTSVSFFFLCHNLFYFLNAKYWTVSNSSLFTILCLYCYLKTITSLVLFLLIFISFKSSISFFFFFFIRCLIFLSVVTAMSPAKRKFLPYNFPLIPLRTVLRVYYIKPMISYTPLYLTFFFNFNFFPHNYSVSIVLQLIRTEIVYE